MKCERCGEDAVVHFTQIMGGEMKTTHLCETCAAEKGLDPNPPTPSFQLSNLLAQMGPSTDFRSVWSRSEIGIFPRAGRVCTCNGDIQRPISWPPALEWHGCRPHGSAVRPSPASRS